MPSTRLVNQKGGDAGYQKCHDKVLRDRTFRFVNRNDFVTRVQGSTDYTHIGNPIWFDSKRRAITCRIRDSMEVDEWEMPLASFFHHLLRNYRRALNALDDKNPFDQPCDERPTSDTAAQ